MIRVLLADDEAMIRSALAALLRLEDDIEVIAECEDGEQAVAEALRLQPDVCLLDLEMPGLDGVQVAEKLNRAIATRCVVVTRHARPGVLRRALASGVSGFLPKSRGANEVAAVIRKVAAGGKYVDPEIAADALSDERSPLTAGFLREIAGDRIEVRSAGSMPADAINPVAVEAMSELGIDITAEQPKVLTTEAVQASDVVITMGCGDACPFFPGKRYEDWTLDDPAGQGIDAVRPIRDEIRRRILDLLAPVGVEPVPGPLASLLAGDEAGVDEHRHVVRHRRLGPATRLDQVAGTRLAGLGRGDHRQQTKAGRVGQDLED